MNFIGIIPARYESSRFPGKALADLGGKPMIIRVPLIPGHNDSKENIKALADFVKELGLSKVDLLPYHSLGKVKYHRLGMEYKLENLKPYAGDEVAKIKAYLESYGFQVGVG